MEDQLEAFRQEWILEAQAKKNKQKQQPHPPPAPAGGAAASSSSAAPPLDPATSPPQSPTRARKRDSAELSSQFDLLAIAREEAAESAFSPRTALDHYTLAVQAEKEGRLNDALTAYRTAFRLDPQADRAYHRSTLPKNNTRANEPTPLSELHNIATAPSKAPPAAAATANGAPPANGPAGEWTFERQLHLGPDHVPTTLHPVHDKDHESSTTAYINKLAESFAKNPWVRPKPQVGREFAEGAPAEGEAAPRVEVIEREEAPPAVLSAEETLDRLHFIPDDVEQPVHLSSLPREVLLLILRHLSLSSVLPPPPKHTAHDDPSIPATTTTANGIALPAGIAPRRGRREIKRTLKDETRIAEVELDLAEADFGWKMDVEALERFGRTCRFARILTLDTVLWRDLCLRAYVAPHQIAAEESAAELARAQHAGDWRRCFIEHPRVRLDGTYISVVTYVRSGEAQSWFAPAHLITFYRYLRFYPSGMVISFLTTDAPTSVVRKLNPALRAKGVTFGKWRLRGSEIELWGLEDPAIKAQERKYSFRMNLRLKSTQRGRMNKLEMVSLATEHRFTGELEGIPIKPTKPFLFSKVNLYAGDDL